MRFYMQKWRWRGTDVPIRVNGQKLYLQANHYKLATGSQLFIRFVFDMSDDWDGLTTFAQFRQGDTAYNVYLDSNNSVTLPSEITSGECRMMLYGNGGENVIATTGQIRFCVTDNSFISDDQSTIITPSLYEQMVEMVSHYIPFSQVATIEEVKEILGIED